MNREELSQSIQKDLNRALSQLHYALTDMKIGKERSETEYQIFEFDKEKILNIISFIEEEISFIKDMLNA